MSVHGGNDGVSAPLEPARQHVAARLVVFNNQNGGHRSVSVCAQTTATGFIDSAALSTSSIGKRTVKHDPVPRRLVTDTDPPIRSQYLETIASPSPVPPYFRVVVTSACVNGSKTFLLCSGVMPTTVSVIANSM